MTTVPTNTEEEGDIDVGSEQVATTPRVDIEKHGEEGDGGVVKKLLKAGTPDTLPPDGAEVQGTFGESGKMFDSSRVRGPPFKFKLGLDMVIKAWDKCVATMNKGEISLLTCKPEYGYGADGCPPEIPPNSTLVFEIELLDWKKPISTVSDMAEEANKIRDEGNDHFKQQNYESALKCYEKALDIFKFSFPKGEADKEIVNKVKLPCFLNSAACQLKLKLYRDAWLSCEKALDIDPKNVKAYFRRGQAHLGQAEFEKAKADYDHAIKLDPKSKELQAALQDLIQQEQKYQQKQKQMYSKMFG